MPGAAGNGNAATLGAAGHETGLLRLATAGSVDDGKSTLIGRLLHDSRAILADQYAQVADATRRRGGDGVDLALLTDGLRAEREQGITIDVAYRYFATPRRSFVLADTPGHVQYTRNMVTGASTADVAIVLVDARKGVLEQTRRHAFIAALLGIPHLVVAVNKMDLVGFDEQVFESIVQDVTEFAARLDVHDLAFIPVSALHGDNVVDRSPATPWYEGAPLLYHLEHLHIASDRNLVDVRFPVQHVIRDPASEYRGAAGQMAGGVLRVGDPVVVLPGGAETAVAEIDAPDGPVDEAFAPMSVVLRFAPEVDAARGDVVCRPRNRPQVARDVEAMVCWMGHGALRPGTRYALKHTTRWTTAEVLELRHRIDVDTLHRDLDARELRLNDIGRLRIRTAQPLVFDPYARNRAMGAFILVDEATRDTVAAGMLLGGAGGAPEPSGGRRVGAVLLLGALDADAVGRAEDRLDRAGATVYRLGTDVAPGDVPMAVRLLADAGSVVVVAHDAPDVAIRTAELCAEWQIPCVVAAAGGIDDALDALAAAGGPRV